MGRAPTSSKRSAAGPVAVTASGPTSGITYVGAGICTCQDAGEDQAVGRGGGVAGIVEKLVSGMVRRPPFPDRPDWRNTGS